MYNIGARRYGASWRKPSFPKPRAPLFPHKEAPGTELARVIAHANSSTPDSRYLATAHPCHCTRKLSIAALSSMIDAPSKKVASFRPPHRRWLQSRITDDHMAVQDCCEEVEPAEGREGRCPIHLQSWVLCLTPHRTRLNYSCITTSVQKHGRHTNSPTPNCRYLR